MAQSIADAIVNYKKEFFGEGNNEPIIEKPTPKKVEVPVVKKEETVIPEKPKEVVEAKGTIFKVQLSASSKKIDARPSNFKGLKNVSSTYENKLYKYTYGETSDYESAKKLLQEAKEKGYSSAFLIAFKDGKSINIKEAIK